MSFEDQNQCNSSSQPQTRGEVNALSETNSTEEIIVTDPYRELSDRILRNCHLGIESVLILVESNY